MSTETEAGCGAVGAPVEPSVRLDSERARFVTWLSAYAGGGEHWRGKVLMGEHDIALALWKDKQREIDRLRTALEAAVRQNEHDMLLTGEELRLCRKVLEA